MIGDGLFVEAGVLSACSRLRRETPECSEVTAVFTRKERSVKKINNTSYKVQLAAGRGQKRYLNTISSAAGFNIGLDSRYLVKILICLGYSLYNRFVLT